MVYTCLYHTYLWWFGAWFIIGLPCFTMFYHVLPCFTHMMFFLGHITWHSYFPNDMIIARKAPVRFAGSEPWNLPLPLKEPHSKPDVANWDLEKHGSDTRYPSWGSYFRIFLVLHWVTYTLKVKNPNGDRSLAKDLNAQQKAWTRTKDMIALKLYVFEFLCHQEYSDWNPGSYWRFLLHFIFPLSHAHV